jgi:hypothetical protein
MGKQNETGKLVGLLLKSAAGGVLPFALVVLVKVLTGSAMHFLHPYVGGRLTMLVGIPFLICFIVDLLSPLLLLISSLPGYLIAEGHNRVSRLALFAVYTLGTAVSLSLYYYAVPFLYSFFLWHAPNEAQVREARLYYPAVLLILSLVVNASLASASRNEKMD